VLRAAKAASWKRVSDFDPSGLVAAHPFRGRGYEFEVPLLAGDHVTDDAGTGFVHTAPSHGADDFVIWTKHFGQEGIPFTVDEDGKLTNEAPMFEGLEVIQLEGKRSRQRRPRQQSGDG
jgi:isoleucyl-tRNA synthetase